MRVRNYVTLGDVCEKGSSNIAQKDLEQCDGEYPVFGASGWIKNVSFFSQEKEYIAIVKDGAGIGRTMLLPAFSSVIGTMQYIFPNEKVDIRYLYYVLNWMNLAKYYSGATIPHIYFRDYKKEQFPLQPLEEQRRIAAVLDKVCDLIALRRKQLERLDLMVKARFVEMFGDTIKNTYGWNQQYLSDITLKIGSGATPKGGKESYCLDGITFIRSMNVYDGRFEYKDLAYINEAQAKSLNNVIVCKNDVFINITGASVARSCIVPDEVLPARVNQHVAIIRCMEKEINPIFLNNMFINENFKKHLLAIGESGGATRQAITKQQLESLFIIVPPLNLQQEFADFVTEIDKLKLPIQRSLDTLEVCKKSLMQEYFG